LPESLNLELKRSLLHDRNENFIFALLYIERQYRLKGDVTSAYLQLAFTLPQDRPQIMKYFSGTAEPVVGRNAVRGALRAETKTYHRDRLRAAPHSGLLSIFPRYFCIFTVHTKVSSVTDSNYGVCSTPP
jgi:hypothetical protein